MDLPELDNLRDGYWWAHTKDMGVWRMLRKSTDRQTWGQPWKDMEDGSRTSWLQIVSRYDRLEEVRRPT